MKPVLYRAPTESEIGRAGSVFLTSVSDLAARMHLPPPDSYTPESVERLYGHIHRTGIFEIAESEGQFVAVCHAVVRERLWFLSGFWVLPEYQRQRVGGPLLRRVWEEGKRRGASIASTWSSIDLTAMASYLKMGMSATFPILRFRGTLKHPLERPPGYEVEPLHPQVVASIDSEVRGTRREADHAFWMSGQAIAREVKHDGRTAGYLYADHGIIGPAAWLHADHAEAVLHFAFSAAQTQSAEIEVTIPAINQAAVRHALRSGLQLQSGAHLFASEAFGKLDQYLASGPSLF
jgi:GNAT superfamily N-acetyltransferase